MTTTLRQRCFSILADSVSEVVGRRSVAYSAIQQAAAAQEDRSKERWAETVFNEISAINRRRIRSTAIDKAYVERDRHRSSRQADTTAHIADLSKLFGRMRSA